MAILLHSPQLEQYAYPDDCPFTTHRAAMTVEILESMSLLDGSHRVLRAPEPADRNAVEQFHSPRYLDVLRSAQEGHLDDEGLHMGLGTPETPVFRGMVEYAMAACGASLAGAELLLSGQADVVFNPSGGYHHAGPERASGFCYLNDVALACLALADRGRRVLFLDVDAHHGDGVQNAFYGRSDVMTLSFHESGKTLFPGTGFVDEIGEGDGKGYSANVPLPVGTYDDAYLKAFRAVALPLIGAFDPDAIVFEVGMDGLAGDPLADLSLTNGAYADVADLVLKTGKPILATGGGGYHARNTARGWALVWSVLCGEHVETFDMGVGFGGVLLETTDWQGGLRDRALVPDAEQLRTVGPAVAAVIAEVKERIFPLHGLA